MDPSGAESGSRRAKRAVGSIGDEADRVKDKSVGGLMDKLRGLGTALKVGAVIYAVRAIGGVVDRVKQANAQMTLATKNQAQLNRLQQTSFELAQKNGVAYNATSNLIAKTTKAVRQMGLVGEEAIKKAENATASVLAGIRVSGTGSAQAAAGVLQLSQALASGELRGDELRSVLENIPGVADKLAEALGTTVGGLRKMSQEGELTATKVVEGLEKARPKLEQLASYIPLTFGQAFQKVQNSADQFFGNLDKGTGFSRILVGGMNKVSQAMDVIAENADTVSNILIGGAVTFGIRSVASWAASAAAVKANTAAKLANLKVTQSIEASALRQAKINLAGAAGSLKQFPSKAAAANVAKAAKEAADANKKLAATNLLVANTSAQAASKAGLIGTAFRAAGALASRALAAIGGPITLVIVGLVSMVAWAGKAALGFRPIADEAGTAGDYIAVAFEDAAAWVKTKAGEMWSSMKEAMAGIMKTVRPAIVWTIDAFLKVGRAVAGVAYGIVSAFKEAATQIGNFMSAVGQDADNLLSGNFGAIGAAKSVAMNAGAEIGGAFRSGFNSGSGIGAGVSGELIVAGIEALPGQIRQGITDWAKRSGLRERANARANARNTPDREFQEIDPAALSDDGKGSKEKKRAKDAKDRKKTFKEILDLAKQEARLAGMSVAEREKERAILQAQEELERKLSASERQRLGTAIQQRRNNEANLELEERTLDATRRSWEGRVQAMAEEARVRGDGRVAAALEAELEVQLEIDRARQRGVQLDEQRIRAYREAVHLASQEAENVRRQQEAREALKQIAEDARKSIQTAVSDALYAAFSGDIKGIGGFFKTIGNILKRQLAEQITYKLFAKQSPQAADQATVTRAAIELAAPAARAVAQAGQDLGIAIETPRPRILNAGDDLVSAIHTVADRVRQADTGAPSLAAAALSGGGLGGNNSAGAIVTAIGSLNTKIESANDNIEVASDHSAGSIFVGGVKIADAQQNVAHTMNEGAAQIGGAMSQVTNALGIGGGAGGLLGGLLGQGGPLSKVADKLGELVGFKSTTDASGVVTGAGSKLLGAVGAGIGYGQLGGSLTSVFGLKGSSTGATLGGIAGSIVGGPIGAAIGGFIGSTIGGLFKKTKYATSQITVQGGQAVSGAASGRGSVAISGATDVSQAVSETLNRYADALGADVGNIGPLTIGTYKGNYRVSTTGRTGKLKGKYSDVTGFGDDAQAAIEFAVRTAIERGAFTGLSAGIANAIKTGAASVEEAVSFQETMRKIDLAATEIVDPVAAAARAVDEEYQAIREQYIKFGEDTTKLEYVYLNERQKVIEAALENQLSSVKSLMEELRGGELGGASLTDRLSEQDRLFGALESAVQSGQTVDYDRLSEVGKALIEVTRDLEGATPDFYDQVDRVMAVLEAAVTKAESPSELMPPIIMGEEIAAPIVSSTDGVTQAVNDNFEGLKELLINEFKQRRRDEAGTTQADDAGYVDWTKIDWSKYNWGGGGGGLGDIFNVASF